MDSLRLRVVFERRLALGALPSSGPLLCTESLGRRYSTPLMPSRRLGGVGKIAELWALFLMLAAACAAVRVSSPRVAFVSLHSTSPRRTRGPSELSPSPTLAVRLLPRSQVTAAQVAVSTAENIGGLGLQRRGFCLAGAFLPNRREDWTVETLKAMKREDETSPAAASASSQGDKSVSPEDEQLKAEREARKKKKEEEKAAKEAAKAAKKLAQGEWATYCSRAERRRPALSASSCAKWKLSVLPLAEQELKAAAALLLRTAEDVDKDLFGYLPLVTPDGRNQRDLTPLAKMGEKAGETVWIRARLQESRCKGKASLSPGLPLKTASKRRLCGVFAALRCRVSGLSRSSGWLRNRPGRLRQRLRKGLPQMGGGRADGEFTPRLWKSVQARPAHSNHHAAARGAVRESLLRFAFPKRTAVSAERRGRPRRRGKGSKRSARVGFA